MATLVINRNSISLNLESDHLVIHRHVIDGDEPERETLPVKDIDRVLIVGRPAISFSVLVRLMDCGIPCCFMTRGGRWRGILKSGLSHNGARRRLQSGKWFGLYYGSWLMYLGKADQAREYFRSVVRANLREAWSWLYLGRSYKGERERQRTCCCQALCCPVRDPTIGEGLAKKIHADLLSPSGLKADRKGQKRGSAFKTAFQSMFTGLGEPPRRPIFGLRRPKKDLKKPPPFKLPSKHPTNPRK